MRKNKILLLGMFAALFTNLFLGAAPAAAEPSQEKPVTFWSSLPASDSGQLEILVGQYNATNPTHPVEYKNFPLPQTLLEPLANGNTPDLALVDSRWLETLKPKLVPADKILLSIGKIVRVMAEADTFPSIWRSCVVDDTAYAIPFSAETAALVVNPLAFNKVPKLATWQQWQTAALQAKKRFHWGSSLPFFWSPEEVSELFTTFVASLGEPPSSLAGETTGLNLWWDWTNRKRITPLAPPAFPDAFLESATWILSTRDMAKILFKNIALPLPRGKKPWRYVHVEALAFFDENGTWDFAKFLTDYKQLKFWAMNTPTVPVNKQVYLSPDYLHEIDTTRPWMRTYIAMIPQDCCVLNSEEKQKAIGEILLESLGKKIPVKEAALKINQEFVSQPPKESSSTSNTK